MDVVITYVNGLDPVWQEEYSRALDIPALDKRFRDWGTLKYLLRGIEKNMPFVRNVYLVVSGPTQVPEWVSESLVVVTHKEIIPAEFLPTFNSTAIELFLPRIPGLGEEFVYFNDDNFVISECSEEDFFIDGKPVLGFSHHLLYCSLYKKHCRNSDAAARRAVGKGGRLGYIRPQHTRVPLLRSECIKAFDALEHDLLKTVSPLRREDNVNTYFYSDYLYHQGKVVVRRSSSRFFSLYTSSMDKICSFVRNPNRKLMCVNDVRLSEERFERYRYGLLKAMEERFPQPSRFEVSSRI